MKAIRVEQFGEPSVLLLKEIDTPSPDAGQILVRAKAIGVNPFDTYIRSGNYGPNFKVPYTPGADAAGIVVQVGESVDAFKPGDRVYVAGNISGAYAEYILCEQAHLHPLPDNLSFSQGASIGVPYATAYYALIMRARAQAGETVLVHGATGGVGIAAVQLAVARKMTVIGTGGTDKGLQLVKEQGTPYIFNHHAEDAREEILGVNCGRGPDVILEMLANVNLATDLKMIARRGRIAVIGNRGEITINPRDMMTKESHVFGVTLPGATPEDVKEIHLNLGRGFQDGSLNPIVGEELPLSEAAVAHERVMDSGTYGKIILIP